MDYTNSTLVADNEYGNATTYYSQRAFIAKVLDNFNDSSLDATIWSTSTTSSGNVSENSAYVSVASGGTNGATAALTSNGSTGFDLKALSGDCEVIIGLNAIIGSSGALGNMRISNGTTTVTLKQYQNTTTNDLLRIKIDKSAENAYVSVDGGAFGSAIDISSVTTNWYLSFYVNNVNTQAATMNVYFVGYVDGDGSTVDYVSATNTFDTTKTGAVATWQSTESEANIESYVSTDDGSNYTAVDKDDWTDIPNSGTDAKIKLTCTTPSSVEATDANSYITEISMVGGYFDG